MTFAVFAGIVFAIVIATDPSPSLNALIYRWQTGIAAIIAAMAAYFTISKMAETDRRAETRHTDLIALQLMKDRLRLVRAVAAVPDADSAKIEELKRLVSKAVDTLASVRQRRKDAVTEPMIDDIRNEFNRATRTFEHAGNIAIRLHEALKSPDVRDAEDLFGPELRKAFAAARRDTLAFRQRWAVEDGRSRHHPWQTDGRWVCTTDPRDLEKIAASAKDGLANCVDSYLVTRHRLLALLSQYPTLIEPDDANR